MFEAAGERHAGDAASARHVAPQHRASAIQQETLKPRLGATFSTIDDRLFELLQLANGHDKRVY